MNPNELAEFWFKIKTKLKESVSENTYEHYIKPIMPVDVTDEYFKVEVKGEFFKNFLEEQYSSLIEGAISSQTGKNLRLIILTADSNEEIITSPKLEETQNTSVIRESTINSSNYENTNLKPEYKFSTFVIGNSNRFAHAAAKAVAENPAKAYNPLFLYGGVGLGKTHLMQAIGNSILDKNPNLKVLYISSEIFINEIINSIQNKTTDAFRKKYRNIDCLIIDDIQFLEGKDATQEEFFHTFNALKDANKQIIISSDRPPKDIKTLEDRLRSRFEQGLIADIQAPDLETRIAIIRSKAASKGIEVPNDVVTLIATNISSNIREIEGAFTKIMAYSSLMGVPINVETAKERLLELGADPSSHTINFEDIVKNICDTYNVKQEELFNKKRTQNIAYARQVAMYLCRELADMSYPKIGEKFGGRDHTTVIHAYEKISKDISTKSPGSVIIENIIAKLRKQ